MGAVLALAKKDLRLLLRDKVGFFFTFFFPLIYGAFFGTIFAGQSGGESAGMSVAVVDEDDSEQSRAFIKSLDESSALRVTPMEREEAADQVRRGKKTAFVVIEKGFGEARERMFWGDPARIEMGVDPARSAEAGMLQGVLTARAFEGFQEAFAKPNVMQQKTRRALDAIKGGGDVDPESQAVFERFFGELDTFLEKVPALGGDDGEDSNAAIENGFNGWQPISIASVDVMREREGPENAYEISFPQAMIWGVLGCAAAFGISMVVERTQGTLVRLRMSPVGRSQILAGKALACFVTILVMLSMMTLFGMLVFDVRPASYALLAMAFVSIAVAFVGIMMFLSVLGKTEQSAGGIGWAVLLVMAMLGGGMIPLFVMGGFMQTASNVSPVKWAILSMEGAVWRGFSFVEMLAPCGILVAVGVVFFAIGARAFRWTEQ